MELSYLYIEKQVICLTNNLLETRVDMKQPFQLLHDYYKDRNNVNIHAPAKINITRI